mgnify:CR=1 FL=1
MSTYQTMIIVGNVGRDAEMRYTPAGSAVTNFSVATNRKYTNGAGEEVEEKMWFKITTWGKQAEICNQYVKKGNKVLVEGVLKGDENGNPRIWNGSDGTPHATFEVTANTVRFLSSRDEQSHEQNAEATVTQLEHGAPVAEDDIPF